MSKDYLAELRSGGYYHIYNRTNNRELLFRDDRDRLYFLTKLKEYICPYAEVFVYCLLGNHFHLLIRVKDLDTLLKTVEKIEATARVKAQNQFLKTEPAFRTANDLLVGQFTRFFTSYVVTFKNRYKTIGNFFYRRFKRVKVESPSHFTTLIFYIHANPRKHKIFYNFHEYKWSSYLAILSDAPTVLERDFVLQWFGNKSEFLAFHLTSDDDFSEIEYLIIED